MSSDRRPLYRPFSEPATDTPVQVDDQARLLPIERAPFLEAPAADAPPVAPGARRRLGPGHLAVPPETRS
ncbi:hypothetical protein GCM10010495_74040 [Kitasatospora herbaricolor]|uniref:hypothetical protein n=1 Tax=Kitasatospora herbaricolor TaxID=68217 RepID=UPI00174E7A83|nr:hypothetical protein [Kitasatospora herbaricolor]MDQ0305458.1 hypothetical protein [Kitasatospora herbaricolor]GGV45653.1 hypothetical protein GCM10010495_74040 [Kitasatospora herbaricolor]